MRLLTESRPENEYKIRRVSVCFAHTTTCSVKRERREELGVMSMEVLVRVFNEGKPFLAVIFLQFGYAGMSIITKFALNQGLSQHVLVVYRHAIATIVVAPLAFLIERKVRPKMTSSIFLKIMLLGLLEPVIDQNLYYTGMKYTTATFTAAMTNVLPAFVFLLAWALRLEKVDIKSMHSQAKIVGTVVTVGGAMLMTLIRGPNLNLPWTKQHQNSYNDPSSTSAIKQDPLKGALMISAGCVSWSGFIILQAITLKSYPVELSLTAWICFMGMVEGSVLALAMEWKNPAAWSIHMDTKFLTAVYGGIVCSGIAYYVQGVIMKKRGPVFVTAFSPLSMVIVAVMGSLILSEIMYLGRVIGATVIVLGLYLVLWGKSKDQLPSNTGSEKIAPSDEEMDDTNEAEKASNQEFVAIDFGRAARVENSAI